MRVIKLSVDNTITVVDVQTLDEACMLVPGFEYEHGINMPCSEPDAYIAMAENDDFTAYATDEECEQNINRLATKFLKERGSPVLCNAVICKLHFDEDEDEELDNTLLDLTDDEIESIIKFAEATDENLKS